MSQKQIKTVEKVNVQQKYQTPDGKEFDTEKEATRHLQELEKQEQLKDSLKDLEEEWKQTLQEGKAKIDKKLAEAEKILDKFNVKIREARELSDQYGIPFGYSTDESHVGYLPETFEKYDELRNLDEDYFEDIFGEIGVSLYGTGWNSSTRC